MISIAFIGLAVLISIMYFDNGRLTMLPTPTGNFAVGRTSLVMADSNAADVMAPVSGSTRKIYAWMWYPAMAESSSKAAPYLPLAWREAREENSGWIITHIFNRRLANVQTHSILNAPLSKAKSIYPVILLRAGGSALTTDYSVLAEDLASHGYVVLGIDAPFRSFIVVYPDGQVVTRLDQNNPELYKGAAKIALGNRLVNAWVADLKFAMDELEKLNRTDSGSIFAGRLDMSRIGVVGHSLGGATALQFCHDDNRCVAGIDVDGRPLGTVINTGLKKPFMFLLGDHSNETISGPNGTEAILADIQSIYARLPADKRYFVTIRGANHYSFSDNAVIKSPIMMKLLSALGIVKLNGRRQLAETSYVIHRFFDKYVKGYKSSLSLTTSKYPEIEVNRIGEGKRGRSN